MTFYLHQLWADVWQTHVSWGVSETTAMWKNYNTEQNNINQREGFPATAAAANLWHWAVFVLHTSHFTTPYSSSRTIYRTFLFWSDASTHTSICKHSGLLAFPHTFPIFVLITALPLTPAGIYSRGMILAQSCWVERESEEAELHPNPSRSGTRPGVTCQKYILEEWKSAQPHWVGPVPRPTE